MRYLQSTGGVAEASKWRRPASWNDQHLTSQRSQLFGTFLSRFERAFTAWHDVSISAKNIIEQDVAAPLVIVVVTRHGSAQKELTRKSQTCTSCGCQSRMVRLQPTHCQDSINGSGFSSA